MTTARRLAALSIVSIAAAAPAFAQDADEPLMRDFMGINAHTVQFKADLYAPLCRLVRDYHPLAWDIDGTTATFRPFPIAQHIGWKDTSGLFRSWDAPVNWNEIYSDWKKNGYEIDACVQFNLKLDEWANPTEDAYRYGKAFAEYFGPSGEHKLVTSVEIGNEPAGNNHYTPEQYKVVFEAMARGIRDGDPALKILTATAEAPFRGKPDGWSMPLDIFKDTPQLYDVINIHKYAFLQGWPTWERSFPEDPRSHYLDIIQASIDWRDANASDKEVWITEFGYDASTQKPDPNGPMKDWHQVSDLRQAQWIVRSFLAFAAMDLDRAYLYWFNDSDTPSFHAASGVTRNLVPKPSYWAMRHLYASLGDYRFTRAIEKADGGPWVFEFTHGEDPSNVVWVAWLATGDDQTASHTLDLPGEPTKAERMPTAENEETPIPLQQSPDRRITVELTESPLYVWVKK